MILLLSIQDFARDIIKEISSYEQIALVIAPDLVDGLKMIDNIEDTILLITYPEATTDLSNKDSYGDLNSFLILLIKKNNTAAQSWEDQLLFFQKMQLTMRKIKLFVVENRSKYFDSYKNESLEIKTTFENKTLGNFDGMSIEISIIDNDL